MASCVAGCAKFGRIIVENAFYFRSITNKQLQHAALLSRNFTSTSEAKVEKTGGTDNSEPSENEKKCLADIENLSKKLSDTSEKCNVLDDKYKRALADGENMRMRLTKQIEDAKLFCIQGFCKDLLEVSDILQRATESVPKEEVTEKNPHLKSLYEGLTMTEAQLQSVFRRHGLVPVNPLNEKFNPNFHEALFQQEVEGKAPGTVVVVSKVGYKLHERVIRPALVGVAKASS